MIRLAAGPYSGFGSEFAELLGDCDDCAGSDSIKSSMKVDCGRAL